MKKALMTIAIALLALAARAQIKVHDDNWVSIGCLNGDFGLQVTPTGYTYFRTQDSISWSWATLSYANNSLQKHWIVSFIERRPNHTFFVTGEGDVYRQRTLTLADPGLFTSEGQINDAGLMLDNITGYYFTRNDEGSNGKRDDGKRRIGVISTASRLF